MLNARKPPLCIQHAMAVNSFIQVCLPADPEPAMGSHFDQASGMFQFVQACFPLKHYTKHSSKRFEGRLYVKCAATVERGIGTAYLVYEQMNVHVHNVGYGIFQHRACKMIQMA